MFVNSLYLIYKLFFFGDNMEKVIKIFLINIIFFFNIGVFALSRWDSKNYKYNVTSDKILEDTDIIRDNFGNFIGINVNYVIPNNYKSDTIIFCPDIFSIINQYVGISSKKIKININIVNNSLYNYKYKNNSLIIQTNDIERLGIDKNFSKKIIGFDNRNIYDGFIPYRTYNSAIKSLYGNKKYNSKYLLSKNINKLLKKYNYDSLSDYYLYYYNKKYNLRNKSIDQFDYSIIREMFMGNRGKYREDDNTIIALGYNYFYNKVLYISNIRDDVNSELYSVGSYMRGSVNDYLFYDIEKNSIVNIDWFNIYVNDKYYTVSFKDYYYSGYMEFTYIKD